MSPRKLFEKFFIDKTALDPQLFGEDVDSANLEEGEDTIDIDGEYAAKSNSFMGLDRND